MANNNSKYAQVPDRAPGRSSSARQANKNYTALGANYKSVGLEQNKVVKIFDMGKFKQLLEFESKQVHPNRNYLQNQCISVVSFVVEDEKLLNIPSWIMIINIVALDLFRDELGFGNADLLPMTMMAAKDSFTYDDDDEEEEEDYRYAKNREDNASIEELNFGQRQQGPIDKSGGSFFASKRAFAIAAAEGAYNDHHDKEGDAVNLSSTEDIPAPNSTTQQSSSSSGFDSHCSSQITSSATSSSSNIAGSRNAAATDGDKQKTPSVLQAIRDLENGNGGSTDRKAPRGMRPAKLPHDLSASGGESFISAPIKIPALPNEPAAKANLILVSPTGLSPPTRTEAPLAMKETMNMPIDFKTIKHIDDQGQCNILYERPQTAQGSAKLKQPPPGIPAHAQLAPPATQRHILRYLMSVNHSGRLVEPKIPSTPGGNPVKVTGEIYDVGRLWPATRASISNNQRPLPILPNQNRVKQAQRPTNESLYYSGLQARVSLNKAQHRQLQKPSSNSAINITNRPLKEFCPSIINTNNNKLSFSSQFETAPHMKPSAYRLAKPEDVLRSFVNGRGFAFEEDESETQWQPKFPITRPMAKLFKAANRSQQPKLESKLSPLTRSKFTSADDLLSNHQQSTADQQSEHRTVWSQLGSVMNSSFRSRLLRSKSKSSTKLVV